MGDHRTTTVSSTGLRVGLSVALVALLAGGGYLVWQKNSDKCDDVRAVSVIADTGVKDFVERLTERAEGESCLDFTVEAVAPSHTGERLTGRDAPQIWVAESQSRIRQVRTALGRSWSDIGPSLGVSPVVVAGRTHPARLSWTDLMTDPKVHVDPPAQSDVSNAAVVGSLAAVSSGSLTHGTLIEDLTKRALLMNNNEGTSDLAKIADGADPAAALTTEREVVKYARSHSDDVIEAKVPESGTVNLDYRIADVSQSADQGLAAEAIRAIVDVLQTEDGRAIRDEEGIRPPDGSPLAGGEGVGDVAALQQPNRELVDNILRKWSALTKPIRSLVVQDVSGSMTKDAGGRSRAELLREASLFGLKQFPKNTALGYWAFSINRGGDGKDYREILPIRPLAEKVDGSTQRALLGKAVDDTLSDLAGGTGLYDTVLAAFRSVYDSYDPAYSNSVIIMTDGRNEDRDTITLAQLVSELNIMKNPARRIPVIAVGISEDADAAALKRIADATGGKSFIARDPQDIGPILLQAVSFRAEGA
ncbi:substrate-binding domain-containing protein [Gordonia hydrophobica]|uniref:Substrate-binding domain-containing protein n=1 Tax=Gordonia hydrophobica TaxID=40516 RepID=A0ABZ2U0B0_9ACTN|nr:substrate-binding domain-containing protein [Gordonia hydrophobica]MBM7369159.1 hypothetical protein [Gordonia hydrophobica]